MVDERNDGIEVAEEITEEVTEVVTDEISDEVSEDTYALDSNLREGIYDALHAAMMHTEYGDRPRYCLCDYDTEAKIIYAWDEEDWLLYGFNYAMDGDKVVIDFESKKRMKYVIAEFDEGEDDQPSPFAFAYEEMKKSVKSAQDDLADMQSKYNDASEQINSLNEEVTELRQFKANSEAADEQAKRDELFANFSDLSEVEEFSALVADAAQYNLDELEEKCFAIRGKNVKMNFSKSEPKAPKLPVEHIDDMDNEHEPYGGVLKQYLIRK